MSEFIIDAPLLACPDPTKFSTEDFQKLFIDFLTRLSDLTMLRSSCKTIRFWRDEDLAAILHEENCFPFRHSLAHAFGHLYEPAEFQLEDINILATTLLEKSMRLEDAGEIKDIIVSGCSLAHDPVTNRNEIFLSHVCRIIALALPVLGNGKDFDTNTYLASCGLKSNSNHVVANYKIEMAEFADGSYSSDFSLMSVQLANYRGAISLFKEVDLAAWWATSTEEAIIDVCAIEAGTNQPEPWQTMRSVRDLLSIGANFISSARYLGFMHDPTKINRLLRVCADVALKRNLADSHWLRDGKGPNAPQKVREEWRAWRHDIDQEFHLHYWRHGNRIELANVVVHNDFNITP